MRKFVLPMALAIVVGVTPIVGASPALATVNYDDTPVGCGLNPDDIGLATGTWGSSAHVETQNDNQFCYLVTVGGHMRYADGSYNYLNAATGWVGGYPGRITWPKSGNIVEAAGSHNACEAGYTNCNGYTPTLAYQ